MKFHAKNLHWLPDWTDETQYKNGEDLSHNQWTWEFLRRSNEYCELWYSLLEPYKSNPKIFENARRMQMTRRLHGELRIRSRGGEIDENLEEIARKFNEKFGLLVFPPNPSENNPLIKFENVSIFTNVHINRELKLDEKQVLCIVDLEVSLEDQIKGLKKRLKVLQDKSKKLGEERDNTNRRARIDQYKDYIRIIDAKFLGVDSDRIAAKLYSKEKNLYPDYNVRRKVNEQFEAAKDLLKNCYKFLPFKDKADQ